MVNSNHSPTPLYSSDWGICFDMPHAYLLIKSKKTIYFVYLSLPLFTFSIIVYQILNFYFSLKWTFPLNMDFVRNFLFIIVFLTFVFVYLTKWILNLNIEFRISSFLWSGQFSWQSGNLILINHQSLDWLSSNSGEMEISNSGLFSYSYLYRHYILILWIINNPYMSERVVSSNGIYKSQYIIYMLLLYVTSKRSDWMLVFCKN